MRRGSCVEDFSIHLLSRGEEGVYLTGDVIRGHVTLELLQHLSLTNTQLCGKRRNIRVKKQELLMILRSYISHPNKWKDMLEEIKTNAEQLPGDVNRLYQDGSYRQLRERMSTKITSLLKLNVSDIQDTEIRKAVEDIRKIERRLVQRSANSQATESPPSSPPRQRLQQQQQQHREDQRQEQINRQREQRQQLIQERRRRLNQQHEQQPGTSGQSTQRAPRGGEGRDRRQEVEDAMTSSSDNSPPRPPRRRRRRPLSDSIRENQLEYNKFIKKKVPKLLRLLGVSSSSSDTIRISIKGRAFVHWTEQALRGVGEPRYKDTHHHSAVEDYFDHTLVLFGQTKNDRPEKCYLPAGRYTYPFKYQLPTNLPSSFEGEFGYIRYWVKATIEKGREQCHVTQRAFTVISPLDLNKVPDSNNPVQETSEKQLCCFCCLSGPISAVLCLQKRGYVPGEPIKFGAEVSNMSSRKMSCYSVELKMTTIYKTPTKSRSVSRQICKTRRHSVGKGQTDTWMSDQLLVPPLPPSCLIGCSIISIKYTLELRVDPVGPAFDLTLPIEVVIGTIPHRITQEHHYANIHRQTSSNSNGTHRSDATDRSGDSQRQLIGVQVLPVQGGHLIINPAYSQQSSNRASAASASSSERSHPPQRPPSRTSNAPSQSSTLSFTHKQLSTVFLESPYGRMHIQFEGDGKEFVPERHRFAPVYPVYQWRR